MQIFFCCLRTFLHRHQGGTADYGDILLTKRTSTAADLELIVRRYEWIALVQSGCRKDLLFTQAAVRFDGENFAPQNKALWRLS